MTHNLVCSTRSVETYIKRRKIDYDILGVESCASPRTIGRAYRAKMRTCHPDKNDSPDARAIFQKVVEARDMALDAVSLRTARGQASAMAHSIVLSLEDVAKGKRLRLRLTRRIVARKDDPKHRAISVTTLVTDASLPCPRCRGCEGFASEEITDCPRCGGSGTCLDLERYIYSNEVSTNSVLAPPGTAEGGGFIIPTCGPMFPGWIPGDLRFIVSYAPHPTFAVVLAERGRRDLHTTVRIPLADALVGEEVSVLHPDGKTRYVQTPAVISPGEIRVKGQGLRVNGHAGDLVVHTYVVFPVNRAGALRVATDVLRRLRNTVPRWADRRNELEEVTRAPRCNHPTRPQCAQQ